MLTRSAFLSVVLIAGVTGAAVAEDEEAEARAACTADYQKLCADVIPGGGRIQKCLESNMDKLDAACKTFIEANAKKN
jgi:hypothetical protein